MNTTIWRTRRATREDCYNAGLPDNIKARLDAHLDHTGDLIAISTLGCVMWNAPQHDTDELERLIANRHHTLPSVPAPAGQPIKRQTRLRLTHTRWLGFKGALERKDVW